MKALHRRQETSEESNFDKQDEKQNSAESLLSDEMHFNFKKTGAKVVARNRLHLSDRPRGHQCLVCSISMSISISIEMKS